MKRLPAVLAEFMHSFMASKRHIRTDEIAELAAYIAGPAR